MNRENPDAEEGDHQQHEVGMGDEISALNPINKHHLNESMNANNESVHPEDVRLNTSGGVGLGAKVA